MNVKYFYSFVVLLFVMICASAQEKKADTWKKSVTIKAFKTNMKEKKYSQAKNEIDGAIKKYPDAAKDAQMYVLKAEALTELITGENRKIYLNQKPDTVQYFNYMYEMYSTGLMCDSLEQASITEKVAIGKKAVAKYRPVLANKLMTYRKKILTAGKFFYKKKDYANAYKFFDMYAQTKTAGMLSDKVSRNEIDKEEDLTEVASLAVLSAYASSNSQGVLKYLSESLKDKNLEKNILEIGSKATAELGDTTEMVNLLENGFYNYPETEYYFITLVKYYNEKQLFDKALVKATRMTELFANNRDYWFVRGKEELLLEKYDEALVSFCKCVEIKADDAESFSALGNIYLHEAHVKYAQFSLPLNHPDYGRMKDEIKTAYTNAMNNFEQAKKFDESKTALWLEGLREVYFKLNKGKELKSLDAFK